MRGYFVKRALMMVPTLFFVSFLIFSAMRMVPGDTVELMVAESGYAEDEAELREILGLDKPLLSQYAIYMSGVVTGDFGTSLWSGAPVIEEISRRLPVSLMLAGLALMWTILLGVSWGILSSLMQDTWADYLIRSTGIAGLAVPGFWIATLVLVFGAIWFSWVPPMDYIPFTEDPIGNLSQLLVPSLVLSLALSASVMRMTRTMMLEVLTEDYIRTARAKGLAERVVIMRHALKNAMIPVLTIMGLQLAFLAGGTIIIPIDIRIAATTRSITRNGRKIRKPT